MQGYRSSSVLIGCIVAVSITGASGAEFSLVPIDAGTHHVIDGREITLFSGDTTVTLELRLSGWDPDLDGDPRLRSYDAAIDSSGFASADSGSLCLAAIPCSSDEDCFAAAVCEDTGLCNAEGSFYVDLWHPEFVFLHLGAIVGVDVSLPDVRCGGLMASSVGVADSGVEKYAGTLILDVSADATGTFTVGFISAGTKLGLTGPPWAEYAACAPARITVVVDCNANGVPDEEDIADGTSKDCNDNGRPDECEPDCNENYVADSCDISAGTSEDCDSNGVPDECEPDCNDNSVADECDVIGGTSDDCNENYVPDECEPGWDQDCNDNYLPDLCDIFDGISADCNANAVPDECDIAAGTSEDCTENGVPDECERDCNRTGMADSCDILNGTSEDLDGDGIPDECVQGFSLMPVSATTGHLTNDNEIIVPMGGTTVTLEIRVSGWDPDLDGVPSIRGCNVQIDSWGFTSGDAGALELAAIPCTTDDDCFAASTCGPTGVCDAWGAAFVDRLHPNFVFFGLQAIVGVDVSTPDLRFGAATHVFVDDPGVDRYTGTVMLDVSPDATGTFTVGFLSLGTDIASSVGPIEPAELIPALITVLEDCNNNGVRDDVDIAEGTSEDANGNGIPDECEFALPSVAAEGARYLIVTPAPDTEQVALRVTSPQFPCLVKYLASDSGMGSLVDSPVFLLPAEWGTVYVADPKIVPGTTYQVRADLGDDRLSLGDAATTSAWGDVVAPWGDISLSDITAVVERFENLPTSPPVEQVDLYPEVPDGVIDVRDIALTVDAFTGSGYPLGFPCP